MYELKEKTHIVQSRSGNSLVEQKENIGLWHNRLGHMSITGLQVLSKQELLKGDEITK